MRCVAACWIVSMTSSVKQMMFLALLPLPHHSRGFPVFVLLCFEAQCSSVTHGLFFFLNCYLIVTEHKQGWHCSSFSLLQLPLHFSLCYHASKGGVVRLWRRSSTFCSTCPLLLVDGLPKRDMARKQTALRKRYILLGRSRGIDSRQKEGKQLLLWYIKRLCFNANCYLM